MTFEEILDQALAMLQRRGRVAYRTLQRQFHLDADTLADLLTELRYTHGAEIREEAEGVMWIGGTDAPPALSPAAPGAPAAAERATPEAERRQLTVMFCDLVDSTVLSGQLDPEDLREVVRAYQETCAKVIARFEGHIAQYLGDGLLVYFGYPLAHEDDAQRAVRAGLGIVEALGQLHTRLGQERGVHLAVRLGIHTGLVVVGEVGGGPRQEQLALGETPNLAARLQGLAAPNTLVISAATLHLLGGFFACQPLGTPLLKGLTQPLAVYRVLYESMARSRLEAASSTGWTPLVGREQESGLLLERWAQVKEGVGQVVLLSGEAGIGKSRLVQVLQEHVAAEPQAWLTPCQCSPYYQHTALYPLIDLLERVALRFEREESPPQKISKLEGFLVQYGLPLAETAPLLAALLSLPLATDYASLNLSPEQQKQQTLSALLTILLRIAAQQPVLFVIEDLHWVDPSTLEFLSLLVDQGPTARILALCTFRPDFSPPWTGRSHLTQVALHRLTRPQAVEVIRQVAHGKGLPSEVVEQIVAKTDGVPLFIEELTKMVLESGLFQEQEDRYELTGLLPPLAIPTTLHDSLMARLDRLATGKDVAQLAATLGRTFSYALLRAVSPLDEPTLQQALARLLEAELLYQRGVLPQAMYLFKHALIQEAAYQSLLKSTRQHVHQRIAQVLEAQFSDLAETQPELIAHHYTGAGLAAHALPYWQQAGERTAGRSAHAEAIGHFRQALEVLALLPDTAERARQELTLQRALGASLLTTKGFAAPEVALVYTRARELCQGLGDTQEIGPVLFGLWGFFQVRGDLGIARELAEQLLTLAQRQRDPALRLQGHRALGDTLCSLGEWVRARAHLEQGIALYHPQQYHSQALLYGQDPIMGCRTYAARALWVLGYPDQALHQSLEALTLTHELSHPFSRVFAQLFAAWLHGFRREWQVVQEWTETLMVLAREHGFTQSLATGSIHWGCALAAQGRGEEGIPQIRQGLAAYRATGGKLAAPSYLALLAEAYRIGGQPAEGLQVLAESMTMAHTIGEGWYEAERHRLKGALLLALSADHHAEAAACFQQALAIARRQQAKSWELRAATSLARLWQRQGKRAEARELLVPVYGWFTEGFDTADLQEAKALVEALA